MDPGIGCENKYFINISEECYHHWKIVKEEMGFKEDEDLLYYLMNLKRRTLSVALEYVVVSNLSKDLCCVLSRLTLRCVHEKRNRKCAQWTSRRKKLKAFSQTLLRRISLFIVLSLAIIVIQNKSGSVLSSGSERS